jgi:hypothetical protein
MRNQAKTTEADGHGQVEHPRGNQAVDNIGRQAAHVVNPPRSRGQPTGERLRFSHACVERQRRGAGFHGVIRDQGRMLHLPPHHMKPDVRARVSMDTCRRG